MEYTIDTTKNADAIYKDINESGHDFYGIYYGIGQHCYGDKTNQYQIIYLQSSITGINPTNKNIRLKKGAIEAYTLVKD